MDETRAGAVHEAAHAVVAWTVGLKVCQLRIGDDGNGASCIKGSACLPIIDQIAVAAAGMEAVELLNADTWETAGVMDFDIINNLLDDYPEDQREHLISRGQERARGILTSRLTVLSGLADALALSGSLDETALGPFMKAI